MRFHLRAVAAIGVVAALLGAAPPVHSQAPAAAGRLVEVTIPAPALKDNLLGDPAESPAFIYLPPGYDASPQRRYPTLYLLHGFTGNQYAFTRGHRGFNLEAAMEDLIRRGIVREMIVVVPSGRNGYFGSFYTNSPVTGRWEDFFATELVAWVDGNYRTLARSESRGIAGHSMGGYGAFMLAMKHPDVFSAVYALSPCCVGIEADMGPDNPAWKAAAKVASRDELKPRPQSFESFYTTAFIALSAALSPNPHKAPLFVDLPFVERDGRMQPNEEAYARWRANMPLYLVEQYRTNLLKLRGIYLDYGTLDEFPHIRVTTRLLSQELADRGIGHTFEVYEDADHGSRIRERLETRLFRFFSDLFVYE